LFLARRLPFIIMPSWLLGDIPGRSNAASLFPVAFCFVFIEPQSEFMGLCVTDPSFCVPPLVEALVVFCEFALVAFCDCGVPVCAFGCSGAAGEPSVAVRVQLCVPPFCAVPPVDVPVAARTL
jgi:hypothetical protein